MMASIQIPNGDYTSAIFRAELQTQLNAAAFQGRIPEGSGTQYVVSGTNNEIRVGTSETLVFGQDTFVILGEPYLKELRNTKNFITTWDSNQPRSANAICGNMGTQNLQKNVRRGGREHGRLLVCNRGAADADASRRRVVLRTSALVCDRRCRAR